MGLDFVVSKEMPKDEIIVIIGPLAMNVLGELIAAPNCVSLKLKKTDIAGENNDQEI